MPNIIVTGPESTGKTTLAKALTQHYRGCYVEEYARAFLTELKKNYTQKDLISIAKGQLDLATNYWNTKSGFIFYDTLFETIKIWSEVKYGNCDLYLTELNNLYKGDFYLLLLPDVAWQPDPLRESPNQREMLFKLYKNELELANVPYAEISGIGHQRYQQAILQIDKYFS